MVKIEDIAREVNVSPATVSRCLRKDPSLSIQTETGKKIYEAALRLGYSKVRPIERPKQFIVIHKDSHFLDDVDNGYYFSIRSGIEEYLSKEGDICRFIPISRIGVEDLVSDGALVIGNYCSADIGKITASLQTENIVFVGKLNFFPECYDTVTYDVAASVRYAMEILYSRNLRKVLFIDGRDCFEIPENYLKIHSVREFVSSHPDMVICDYIESNGFGSAAGYEAMSLYLASHKNEKLAPAIFAGTDPLAIGVVKAITEAGIEVGKDVHLISLNGDNSGRWISPTLATIDIHTREMGLQAAKLVKERSLNPAKIHRCITFDMTFIEGDSLGVK
jgi:Transcriptional regulators